MHSVTRLLTVVLLSLLVVGCGASRIKARGRLVQKGEPFVPGEKDGVVHVAFFPDGQQSDDLSRSYLVKFNRADGTFQVTGADGKGVPPGKYRVTVALMKNHKDEFKGRFNAKNSPLLCEVKNASEEITLDLASVVDSGPATGPAKGARKSRS